MPNLRENSKHQAPNPNQSPNFKPQNRVRLTFWVGIRDLVLVWGLEFKIWCFPGAWSLVFVCLLPSIHLIAQFAETLKLVEEGAAADAEGFSRFGAIEVVLAQGLEDSLPLDFAEPLGIGQF